MSTLRRRLSVLGRFFSVCLALVAVAPKGAHCDHDSNPSVAPDTERTCNANEIREDKKILPLILEPKATSISFKCAADSTALEPAENQVFVDEICSISQQLTQACATASLERGTSPTETHTLKVNTKPAQDTHLYFKCKAANVSAPRVGGGGSFGNPQSEKKDCIVKITVKGVSPATIVPTAHICDPKEQTDDSVNLKEVTLEADKQSIDFSCGNEAGAQLTPATSLKKFCTDEGCQEQKELSSVWSDAALTTAGSGAATSYTLSIRSERKEDKDIYYKCSVPASNKTKVEEDGATGKEKSCVLKITVKSGETSLAAALMAVSSCLVGQIILGLLSF
ncbi:SAG-related sequence [Besnoitia besnoiti]|uniref:SAG-related sequence n=1 Tax=Besnoitia besnoiti TaxID=94643 RepID=A0A2A9MKY4_BESBE|nr:SAG-related sequence [Besnoitia besnoiti]PFH36961.1 SAG-related sequence [Besnoitia besnoiti]